MNIVLFDPETVRGNLLPLTYTRPVSHLRVGIDTIAQKWQAMLPGSYFYDTVDYLRTKFVPCTDKVDLRIAGNVVPNVALVSAIANLVDGEALYANDTLIAVRGNEAKRVQYVGEALSINMLYDIFLLNDQVLRADFDRLTADAPRREPSDTVTVIGDRSQLFIHPEASAVEGCVINVAKGPVYIGPGAEVMEGVCMRGPIALCEHSTINMGAKIYGATTIGPWSKVGGEVNNAVILGYSNKAHDGFLGNAVIGEWCNLGAGCVASNLKNDYTEIKLWNYPAHRFLRTGLQFCGLIMGDHSKAGINTMLNTATVLGVGVNIHGSGFPRPFLASFSEGSTAGFNDVPMRKFFETARKVMARRGIELTDVDEDILNRVREIAEQYR
jgi:UDP-N-acetylglucosamine diphosphorylase/glucosamine-1-phosphate N-acetyltransferase